MSVQHGSKTNLQKLKTLAKALLYMEPELTEFSPMIIHHPFSTSGVVGLKDSEGNMRIGNIVESKEDMEQWRQLMSEIIDSADSAMGIYIHITKPYIMGFVKHAAPFLSREDFSSIFANAWITSECPNHDPNLPRGRLLAMFRAADPQLLMDDQEREMLDGLEDVATIYRGVRSAKPGSVNALSWTLDKNIAGWFASRYGQKGTVYEAKIEKKHIQALFLGRNESEVIVDPKYLMEVTQVQDLKQEMASHSMEGM